MMFFTSFYVILTAKLVFSSQCHEGYFSDEYKKCIGCPQHCLICDSGNSCLSCQDGYWGSICELPCSRCQPKTSCEKTNGFCFEKCKDGYTGILCDAFCNDKCLNCDRMNAGLCDLCALGLYGESCDKRCPEFCKNNICNNSGYCTYGCDTGYWGPNCGNNCSSNCNSSCDTQTAACISVKSNINVDVSRNKGEENDEKAANDEEDRQTANDDKENEASRQGRKIWPVILIVVAVLIFVSGVVCVVFRKKLNNLRRRGLTRQAEPEAPIDSPLIQTRELTTSKDSGVCSQESPPTSLTQDTVELLQLGTAFDTNNEPRNDQLEKIIIIPEFLADKIESAKFSDCDNATGLDNDSQAEACLLLDSLSVRYISDFSGEKAYIICKDPTNKSKTDTVFWNLVWKKGCSIIVKLSRAIEETPERRYWPDDKAEHKYGDVIVTSQGLMIYDEYRRRTFVITMENEPRAVEQMQFTKWPIDRLPADKESLINFLKEVNKQKRFSHGPLLVHCSDGFSRSCVFIALDMLLGELEKQEHDDIGNILIELQDKGLITTAEQSEFLRNSWDILRKEIDKKKALSAPLNYYNQKKKQTN